MSDTIQTKSAGTPSIEILTLTTAIGDKIDITHLMVTLEIFEDMFSPTLTGNIIVRDTLGLFDKLPISGNEKLTVKFWSYNYDPSNDPLNFIHRTFDVIKITDYQQTKDYMKSYKLHFVSPELTKNHNLVISKSFQQSSISNVVASLMTGSFDGDNPNGLGFPTDKQLDLPINFKRSPYLFSSDIECEYQKLDADDSVELFVEKTKYTEPYITVPYMKPFDIINMLASKSLRQSMGRYGTASTGEVANFLFFENKRGYQFTTIDSLMECKEFETKRETTFVYGNAAQNKTNIEKGRVVDVQRIENLEIQHSYDILKNINAGMYSSRLYAYDMLTGNITQNDYDYLKEYYNTEALNRDFMTLPSDTKKTDFPPIHIDENGENKFTQKYLNKRLLLPITPTRDSDNITSKSTERQNSIKNYVGSEEYIQKRISQLTRLNNFKIQFECTGNSKHKVGDCVFIDLTDYVASTHATKTVNLINSKYYSCYYLITSIRHVLTPLGYKMYIEATTESYTAKIGK